MDSGLECYWPVMVWMGAFEGRGNGWVCLVEEIDTYT